jgi:hypothetical protein
VVHHRRLPFSTSGALQKSGMPPCLGFVPPLSILLPRR